MRDDNTIKEMEEMVMDNIALLREKRANLWNQTKAFLDSKQRPDGMISAEDAATYDKMEAEIVDIGTQIERLERRRSLERQFTATTAPLLNTPDNRMRGGVSGDEYSRAFWNAMRGRGVSNALSVDNRYLWRLSCAGRIRP